MEMRKAAEAATIIPNAMLATGVLRNSITWYVRDLERLGELQAVCVKPDKHTKRMAKYYSADRTKWPQKSHKRELCLFDFEGKEVSNGL